METKVHKILEQNGSLAFPGVFDTVSAKLAEQVGFPLAFISGYSVAATLIGEPDFGLLTQTEITERARQICASSRCRSDALDWPDGSDSEVAGNPGLPVPSCRRPGESAGGCSQWSTANTPRRGKRAVLRDRHSGNDNWQLGNAAWFWVRVYLSNDNRV